MDLVTKSFKQLARHGKKTAKDVNQHFVSFHEHTLYTHPTSPIKLKFSAAPEPGKIHRNLHSR